MRYCGAAGIANIDGLLEGKAGVDVADSSRRTLRELCDGMVPRNFLERVEEIGFKYPTQAQEETLPVLLSGADCLPFWIGFRTAVQSFRLAKMVALLWNRQHHLS